MKALIISFVALLGLLIILPIPCLANNDGHASRKENNPAKSGKNSGRRMISMDGSGLNLNMI
jgi:hypothetical protein